MTTRDQQCRSRRLRVRAAALGLLGLALGAAAVHGDEPAGPTRKADLPPPAGGRARIAETVFDAGRLSSGTDVEHEFVVQNRGGGPLSLAVRPGCSCTVTQFDSLIPGGGEGRIRARFPGEGLFGPISRALTVWTNDPDHGRHVLRIEADFHAEIELSPRRLLTARGLRGRVRPQRMTLRATDGQAFDVLTLDNPLEELARVELRPSEAGSGTETKAGVIASGAASYDLVLNVDADTPVGVYRDDLVLTTTHGGAPEVRIPLSVLVDGTLRVSPAKLEFAIPEGRRGKDVKKLRISHAQRGVLNVTSVESSHRSYRAQAVHREPSSWLIEVRHRGRRPREATLTVRTDDPIQPVVEIPLAARRSGG